MTQKFKSIHSITIDNIVFQTRLHYNINTNHIGIGTIYNDSKKLCKNYYKNNKDNFKKYYENNKTEIKEYSKEYYKNNRNPNTLIQGSDEHKIMCSCIKQKINRENFNGFAQEKSYCPKFNEKCRELNRNKYNRKCFICNKSEDQNGQKLSVHHIDMNKNQGCDDNKWALVPVCKSCHSQSHNDLWQNRIEYLLKME